MDFKYDGPGVGKGGSATLLVDGKEVASGNIPRTIPFRISAEETLDFGEDTGTPVSEDYKVPFKFTGTLNKVVISLGEAKLSAEDQKATEEPAEQARGGFRLICHTWLQEIVVSEQLQRYCEAVRPCPRCHRRRHLKDYRRRRHDTVFGGSLWAHHALMVVVIAVKDALPLRYRNCCQSR